MKKHQILLIEPDFILAKIYKKHLEKFNYSVNECGDVQTAINKIDKIKPDIIVMELRLSGHNGYEFLYELRSYPEWQSIPILIHSVISEEELSLNPISKAELGMTSYLYKPSTSLNKLQFELDKLLLVPKL